jgi:hypothetical protein
MGIGPRRRSRSEKVGGVNRLRKQDQEVSDASANPGILY